MIEDARTMTPTESAPLPADDLDAAFRPEAVRLVGDLETLRAISDPTRMRILERMVTRQDPAWSVKELAAALEMPPTRLYHHIDQLVERDLLRAVERRVVSGIIETRYRVSAHSFQLDRRLFAGDADEATRILLETVTVTIDTARAEVEACIRDGAAAAPDAPDHRRLLLSRGLTRLSPVRALELRRRLTELEAEFSSEPDGDGELLGLLIAVYPVAELPGASRD
jgi:DNA-binding transcriptional ArsR family regulator